MAPGGSKKGKNVRSGPVADKPCHNCRRRRLRCDRLVPHCAKCEAKGVECLGYGQLFQWTGAVASRGKLAGQQSSAALYSPVRGAAARSRASISSVSSLSSASPASSSASSASSSAASPSIPPSSPAAYVAPSLPEVREVEELTSDNSDTPDAESEFDFSHDHATPVASCDTQLVCITTSSHALASEASTSTPWVLVDPLYQDITSNHRQYLAYCAQPLAPLLENERQQMINRDMADQLLQSMRGSVETL